MRIDVFENRSQKCRIQIVLYDDIVNSEGNCEVVMLGGTSKAFSFIHLDLQDFNALHTFLKKQPRDSFLRIGDNRFEVRTKLCDSGNGDGIKTGFIAFRLYDKKKEWGYSQIEFEDSEFSWHISQGKDLINDKDDVLGISSNTELFQPARFTDNKLLFHLSIDENSKDDYYYLGHICLITQFLKMERDLLIEISEMQQLRHNVPLLFEKGTPVNFCPLGELIDITFHVKDDTIYVDGEISDLADCPTSDYVFHAIVPPSILKNLLRISGVR